MKAVAKFLVAFEKEDMSKFGKFKFLDTFLEVATNYSPAEYSVEVAFIVGTPKKHNSFFKKGDKVLVMYDVFIRGRYPQLSKGEIMRKIASSNDLNNPEADNDVYWCEQSEVMARFEGDELVAAPGRVLLNRPKRQEERQVFDHWALPFADISGTVAIEGGTIVAPQIAIPDCDLIKRPFWAEVAYDTETYKKGELVFCSGGMFTPLTYGDLLAAHEDSIMAKKINQC